MEKTNATQGKQAFSFRDAYANDPKFKAQIDESRLRRTRQQTTKDITSALATASGLPDSKPKMY